MENELNERLKALQDGQSQDRQKRKFLEQRMDHQDEALGRMAADIQKVAATLAEVFPHAHASQPTKESHESATIRLALDPLPERRPKDPSG